MKKVLVKLINNEKNVANLICYMTKVNNDFKIPLNETINIEEYARKILEKGVVIAVVENDKIIAIWGFYCNDRINKRSYGTIAHITKDAQEKGYNFRDLLHACLMISVKEGMHDLYGETTDPRVLILHKRLGFVEISKEEHDGVIHYYTCLKNIKDWLSKDSGREIVILNYN